MNFAVLLKVGSFHWLVNSFQILSLVLIVLDEHGLEQLKILHEFNIGHLLVELSVQLLVLFLGVFELSVHIVKLHVEFLLVSVQLIFELLVLFLDLDHLRLEFLLVGLSLHLSLDKALLDGLSDAVPLGVGIEVDRGLHDDNVNIGLHILVVQVIELLKALLVELNFALDDGLDLAVHDALVRLAEDGDEEVERHQIEHKDEQSVQQPDEENHELRVDS